MSAWSAFLTTFLPFVYGYPSSCPCAYSTPNKSVTTLRYTHRPGPVYTGHACRHLLSAVPWISEDRLLITQSFSRPPKTAGYIGSLIMTSTPIEEQYKSITITTTPIQQYNNIFKHGCSNKCMSPICHKTSRNCKYAPNDTINAKAWWKSTWIKSLRNHFLWIILIKFNNECASKCILHWLEQTELKYGEALVHSDS